MVSISQSKKLVIGIVILVAVVYFAFTVSTILSNGTAGTSCPVIGSMDENCPHKQEANFLISLLPLLMSAGIVVGAGTYYLMSGRVESKEKSLKRSADVLLKFLNADEKKVVNKLMENNGRILQAEVTRLPEMSKVKSHRVVMKLLDKGVIEKEQMGKTNIIKFTKEIKEGLL